MTLRVYTDWTDFMESHGKNLYKVHVIRVQKILITVIPNELIRFHNILPKSQVEFNHSNGGLFLFEINFKSKNSTASLSTGDRSARAKDEPWVVGDLLPSIP